MRLHLQTHAAHPDRLTNTVLAIDDEFLSQDMQDFLIRRNRHRLGGFDNALDVALSDFFFLDRHHAIRVEALDMATGDTGVNITHLAIGHQFDFLNDPANGVHRIFDVHHDTFFQATRILRPHADHIQMAFLIDFGNERDNFRRPDVQTNHQILVIPAHITISPSPRPRLASQSRSDNANPPQPAVPPAWRPFPDRPR